MIETISTEAGETIRTMTPAEYVRAHDAADATAHRRMELTGFATFLAAQMGLEATLPSTQIDALAAAWIAKEPKA